MDMKYTKMFQDVQYDIEAKINEIHETASVKKKQ